MSLRRSLGRSLISPFSSDTLGFFPFVLCILLNPSPQGPQEACGGTSKAQCFSFSLFPPKFLQLWIADFADISVAVQETWTINNLNRPHSMQELELRNRYMQFLYHVKYLIFSNEHIQR